MDSDLCPCCLSKVSNFLLHFVSSYMYFNYKVYTTFISSKFKANGVL